jgi:hypothetical protein
MQLIFISLGEDIRETQLRLNILQQQSVADALTDRRRMVQTA